MKTLFLYTVQIYLFCSCTCIFGIPQPRPDDSSSKLSYVEDIIKKCQKVSVNATKSNYLDSNSLLCIGVKTLSHRFRGGLEENFAGVETKYKGDICEHFQEMKLNSTQDKLNESSTYNLLFANKSNCERACLDVFKNVNPLCSVILQLSHNSKGSPIVRVTPAPSTIPSDAKEDNDDNEVSGQSRKPVNDVPNTNLDGQQTKGGVVENGNAEQRTISSTQEEMVNSQKSQDENNSVRQGPEVTHLSQTSQGSISPSTDDVGMEQQTNPREVVSVKEKPEATNEGRTFVPETDKGQPSINALPEEKGSIVPGNNTAKKGSKYTDVEGASVVDDNNSEGKSESLLQKKEMTKSSAVLPSNSAGVKNAEETVTKHKIQKNMDTVEDRLPSTKVVADTGVKVDENISQVSNVQEDKGIVNGKTSQADNKETENPSQKEEELPLNNQITKVTPNSNTDEKKANQNNEKAETAQNAEPAAQSDKSETQQVTSDDGSFTSYTGNDVGGPDLHLPGDAGELNDNTELYSGGGTSVDSDVFEAGTNTISNAGAVLFSEREIDDDDSHFFAYFMTTMVFCIVGYLLFHNKQKILALALEGRARRGRRRPNTSAYRKLDSNLEEAISSSKSASVTQVIY